MGGGDARLTRAGINHTTTTTTTQKANPHLPSKRTGRSLVGGDGNEGAVGVEGQGPDVTGLDGAQIRPVAADGVADLKDTLGVNLVVTCTTASKKGSGSVGGGLGSLSEK